MIYALAIAAIWSTALVWLVLEYFLAPWGYEDSRGFHLGKPEDETE